jgi:hypothetical protein
MRMTLSDSPYPPEGGGDQIVDVRGEGRVGELALA